MNGYEGRLQARVLALALLLAIIPGLAGCAEDSYSGDPLLYVSASVGDNRSVERLLGNGVSVDETDESGNTPLMGAAGIHDSTLGILLQNDARVNLRNDSGWTAVMLAYYRNSPSAVKILSAEGPDLLIPTEVSEFSEVDLCDQARADNRAEMVELLC